ncbi:MAG: diguanylate cyclase [Selenomonadaceae bacterium]|nr:diguanylate cyclase [Selenomonadaceae bacterium]
MEINKGIRAKLFALFIIMGAIPFILLVIMGANSTIDDLEEYAKQTGLLRNTIISEHISELIEKNQVVLQSVALSSEVVQYLQEPTPQRRQVVEKILNDTNDIFGDENNMALTGADAWQLIRTDGATLVNLSKRQHFKEAMKGRTYVSDIISSMSTGNMIVVVESPVRNAEGKPIGMVQRNFDLSVLEEFIKNLDEEDSYIILMDRRGHVIATSSDLEKFNARYTNENHYKFILDKIYNSSGSTVLPVNGEKSFIAYSRNVNTGWMIITIRPYYHIMDTVYDKAAKAIIFGMVMLFGGTIVAYFMTIRVTKPIIEMTTVVDEIVSGKAEVDKIEISSNDELGQMAKAFNKMKSDRDAFQLESELDKLTELFNKKTMENLCKMKLKTFNENEAANIFLAFYIIDLDHFKEVNDLLGHQFGDKVLVEFAKGLKKIFRPNDCIGRFGGDEFVVIVDSLPNMEVVVRKAEQIKQIAFNLALEGKSHFVTASIGIAVAPQNGRDYDTLFSVADKAVYHVKNNGKNGYYCELLAEEEDDDKDDKKS